MALPHVSRNFLCLKVLLLSELFQLSRKASGLSLLVAIYASFFFFL